ncbi:MAG: M28 family peptidase, partial [Myxococcales bacterium]|nr:M28 family peptidase [Myxococcales bacterium]
MRKHTWTARLILAAGLLLIAALAIGAMRGPQLTAEEYAFADAVGVGEYAYTLNEIMAYTMGSFVLPLPDRQDAQAFRTCGSAAEHQGADFLVTQMISIGLDPVVKEPFPVQAYETRGASVQVISPTASEVMLASGYTGIDGTPDGGLSGEVVYVGLGRMQDYDALKAAGGSAEGKIVLVDVSEEDMYWLQFPHMEARIQGAIGMVVHWLEYGEIEDSVVTHDAETEMSIPAVSVSNKNFARIKEMAETSDDPVVVKIIDTADQALSGTSYNVIGYIQGTTRADELVIVADHYDTHWYGASDDGSGVARLLGIAKGLVDSGYQPARTLVFVATGCEEWGWTDTEYDWSIGAYNAIHNQHPEWAGKTLGYFNLEGGGTIGATSVSLSGMPEMENFRKKLLRPIDTYFNNTAPYMSYYVPSVAYSELPSTWADQFSFGSHGIGIMNVGSRRPRPPVPSAYHTQMDRMDRISAESLAMSIISNGVVAMRLDRSDVAPYNFAKWVKLMQGTLWGPTLSQNGIATSDFYAARDRFKREGESVWKRINGRGFEDTATATSMLLDTQKLVASELITVGGYVEPLFPHEHYQSDIWVLDAVIDLLNAGDIDTALEYLRWVYGMWEGTNVSPEVYQEMIINRRDPTRDDLFWATDRLAVYTDLYSEYFSLLAKRDTGDTDYSAELASIQAKYGDVQA